MKSILIFFSLASCFVLFSCEGENGDPVNYGPAVPQSAVDNALNGPLANADPSKIQVGQFTDVLQTEILEGEAYQTTGEIGTTVVGRDDQDTQLVFTILEKSVSYSDNKTIARELTRVWKKNSATQPATPVASPTPTPTPTPSPTPTASPTPAPTMAATNSYHPLTARWFYNVLSHNAAVAPVSTMISILNKYMNISADTTTTPAAPPTTFHNLVVTTALVPPPDSVKTQTNCGGVPHCLINVTNITFDMLGWTNATTPNKIHRVFTVSGDVPFFANVMSECDSLLVPNGTVKTLVTLCSDVTNFRFTTPP